MQVQYTNTLADLRALRRAMPPWLRLSGLMVVLACIPGTVLLAALGEWRALIVGWVAQPIYLALLFYLVWRRSRAQNNKLLSLPITLTIHERSLTVDSDWGLGELDWSLLRRVRETARHVFLFTFESEAFLVPKSAFADTEQARVFAEAARARFARSSAADYVPFSPPEPAEIAKLEFPTIEPAMRVRFRNTAEELTAVRLYGPLRPVLPWKQPHLWILLALVLALVGFLIWQSRMTPPSDAFSTGNLLRYLSFFLLELFGILVYVMWVAWYLVRTVNRHRLDWQTLTISPVGVFLRAPRFEHHCGWSAIDEIVQSDRFVVFYLGKPRLLCLLPKTAFSSPDESQRFVQMAQQWQDLAAARASPGNAPTRHVSENPYESPEQS